MTMARPLHSPGHPGRGSLRRDLLMALPTTASPTLAGGRRSRLERWIDLKLPISWFELAKRTVKEVVDDDCLGLAAQLAYYFFLALFPALLALVAIASYLPGETVMD